MGGKQQREPTTRRGRVTEQLQLNKKQIEPTGKDNTGREGGESRDKLLQEISNLKGDLKKDLKDELVRLRHCTVDHVAGPS